MNKLYLFTRTKNTFMKITVYSQKGWAGKTPISTNIVLERGYALGTNQPNIFFHKFIPNNSLIVTEMETPFPTFW